jgi:protein gp37
VPFQYLHDEIVVNAASSHGRRHCWFWLTKQPGRMADFSRWLVERGISWPANLWAMTSVTSQKTIGRVAQLLSVVGPIVRGLSVEPMLGPVALPEGFLRAVGQPWVIGGGPSGKGARPIHPDWARSLRDQCQAAKVPFFWKQWGEWFPKALMSEAEIQNFWKRRERDNDNWGVIGPKGDFFAGTSAWNGRGAGEPPDREHYMFRLGKKVAGRLLDGREWNEFPTVTR